MYAKFHNWGINAPSTTMNETINVQQTESECYNVIYYIFISTIPGTAGLPSVRHNRVHC